jgi:hypothetical protein
MGILLLKCFAFMRFLLIQAATEEISTSESSSFQDELIIPIFNRQYNVEKLVDLEDNIATYISTTRVN